MGTITIFMASLGHLGPVFQVSFARRPLLALIVIGTTVLLMWITALLFWPLFLVPNRAFIKNNDKYDAILDFEQEIRIKYYTPKKS